MTKTKMTLLAAAASMLVGTAAVSAGAYAQNERGPMTREAVAERSAERFAKMDANGDGVLNAADREARMAERFAAMDTDGDGMLSKAEFKAAHEERAEQRSERREARGENRGGGDRQARRGGRGGHGGPAGMIKQADANNDGQVTRAEFQTSALARFDKADADSDGTITREERRAAMQSMRGSRPRQ